MKPYADAFELDREKAGGACGSEMIHLAKLVEEIGQLMKMVSLLHRKGPGGYSEALYKSELGDLVVQLAFLCENHHTTLEEMYIDGLERFKERLKLKSAW